MAFASASPFLKMISASASPVARVEAAWPSASKINFCFCASASVSILRRSISACFEHRRDQLTLAALNFSFLHGNLAGFLDLLDLDLLGHYLLLHDIGLDLVRLVCGRLLLLDSFEEIRLLELEIALSFRLRRLRKCFRKDAFLIGLRFGDGGCAHGLGTLDRGVALGFGGGHVGVPLDPRDIGPDRK